MEVGKIDNISVKPVVFSSTNKKEVTSPIEEKSSTKKKAIIATAILVPAALAAVIYGIRKGKVHMPEGLPNGGKKAQDVPQDFSEMLDNIRGTRKSPEFSPQKLDEVSRNGAIKPDAWSKEDMKAYYEQLERNQQTIEQIKRTRKSSEFSPEKLDKYTQNGAIKHDAWSKEDMKAYYEELEVSQKEKLLDNIRGTRKSPEFSPKKLDEVSQNGTIKPDAWSKKDMKAYYGNNCAEITTEADKKIFTYPADKKGNRLIKTKYNDGQTAITQVNKNGTSVETTYDKNNKVTSIITKDVNGSSTTKFDGNLKVTTHNGKDGIVQKLYIQDKKGNFKCVGRTSFDPAHPTKPYKEVIQLENGNSKTTISTEESKRVIIRDKKGKVLEDYTVKPKGTKDPDAPKPPELKAIIVHCGQKALAPWYVNYQKLCEKYHTTPYGTEAGSGAWKHFQELLLLDTDKKAYREYMNLQKYRARYDTEALLATLDSDFSSYIKNLPENLKDAAVSLIQDIGTMCNRDYELATDYVQTLLRPNEGRYIDTLAYLFSCSPYREISSKLPDEVIIDTLKKFNPEMSDRGTEILTERLNELRVLYKRSQVHHNHSTATTQQTLTLFA
jgi:hypothetical protein